MRKGTIGASDGSVLLAALVVIVVLTLLAGTMMAIYVARYRFIRRDVHRVQARYLAEAALYTVLDSLQWDPFWRPAGVDVRLPGGHRGVVTVEAFGGYLYVQAAARQQRSRYTIRALVGEAPPAAFGNAVYLWDTESSLNVAGETRIVGDILLGKRGLEYGVFDGRGFRGVVEGEVLPTPELRPPYFEPRFYEDALARGEALLVATSAVRDPGRYPYVPARHLPGENSVLFVEGDLHVSAADRALFDRPVTVTATGRLTVEGPLHVQPGTIFAAGRSLRVAGAVTGRGGLFYGRERVDVGAGVRCAGQFISRRHVRIGGDASLAYPSVLFVAGEGADTGGTIELLDSVAVDGVVVHPPLEPRPPIPRGRIVVKDSARVRGAIYNGLETELHGTVYGSLLTYQLYFYASPTSYVNWMKDAVVEHGVRPAGFVLPMGFSRHPRMEVLVWEGHADEGEREADT